MKRLFAIFVALCAAFVAVAQSENSIIIDQNSFRPLQSDALTGVNIDPIGVDSSRRPCARIKMKINRMTREDIDKLDVKIVTNNQLTKCKTADYENGLILEMTAKPATCFYLNHPRYGESNEVNLNLEPNKEYRIDAYLNQQLSITIISDVVGADVYIDDIFVGQTNANKMLAVHNVTPEKHALRIEYSGRRVAKEISVNSDNLAFMHGVLSEMRETKGPYKVGDYYNDGTKEGVVFQTSPQVKIVSVVETTAEWGTERTNTGVNGDNGKVKMSQIKSISGWLIKYPAFKWCADLGDGWYLPTINELEAIYSQRNVINSTLSTNGFEKLGSKSTEVWSSTEKSSREANTISFDSAFPYDDYYKNMSLAVRAVCVLGDTTESLSSSKMYKVGDYYNDGVKEGVVFEVSADGKHGKIVSMMQSAKIIKWSSDEAAQMCFIGADNKTDGAYNMTKIKSISGWQSKYPAFKWCADIGDDWYLPAIEELEKFALDDDTHREVNHTLAAKGGTKLYNCYNRDEFEMYWSSTECDCRDDSGEFRSWYVLMDEAAVGTCRKGLGLGSVRAVARF